MIFKREWFQDVAKDVLDFIFPSNIYCICCDNLIDKSRKYALCDECLDTLDWANGYTCDKCGKALIDTEKRKLLRTINNIEKTGLELCDDCKANTHFFERAFTCLKYGHKERELVHKYKYNGKAYMGEKLGRILLDRILIEKIHIDIVTAVPAHWRTKAKRGYNQTELMAKVVAKGLRVVYNNQVLIRKNYKAAMNKLDVNERFMNVKDAYGIGAKIREISNKRILVIDDVYTAGSTADECSRILLEAGAKCVYVLTLASGAN